MSYKGKYVSVIIVAAGMGKRMKSNINKQFMLIKGRPILSYTIEKFEQCEYVDEIIIVTREEEREYCQKNILDRYNFKKVKKIVNGGKERQDSVYNGLLEVDCSCNIVLIHDGARPFVNKQNIIDGIQGAFNYGACVIGVPVKDTIKVGDVDNNILNTPDRKFLWAVQTPQCFLYNIIFDSYKKAIEEGYIATDDSSMVERLGYKVKMIEGTYNNIKITTPEDLDLAELILEKELKNR